MDGAPESEEGGGVLAWASLGEPGRLLTVDAAEPKFHVLMGKPGANEKKGEGPFLCKGPEKGLSPGGVWQSLEIFLIDTNRECAPSI